MAGITWSSIENSRIVPDPIVVHPQGSRGPLIVVSESSGIKEFDNCRNPSRLHEDQVC